MIPLLPLLAGVAGAAEPEDPSTPTAPEGPELSAHGDLKAFVIGLDPVDVPVLGGAAQVQGIGDARLKLGARWGRFAAEAHHEVSLLEGAPVGLPGSGTGVALTAPELVDLTWEIVEDAAVLRGRTDRLWVRGTFGRTDVTLGRQPISFGTGVIFTPLDLVAPFHPATIDQEYKPGVDAARVDTYLGTSGSLTAVAAWAGGDDPLVAAGYGQGTVGLTDLGAFLAWSRGEPVAGLSLATALGAVKLYGDATLTLPEAGDPFVRAVAGLFAMPTGTTTLTAEVYLQTLGASQPDDYLGVAAHPRFLRGEVWQLGRYYAGIAVSQEITPLVHASLSAIANLADPSALLAPGLAWNVAEEAEVSLGIWMGLGRPPALRSSDLLVRSEFGLYPTALFLRAATYF